VATSSSKKIFEGLGPGTLIPQRGKLPFDDPQLGEREGFVLSRVDGHTSLEEICLLVPFDEPTTMVILRRLWEIGAMEVPGVARQIVPPPGARPPSFESLAPPIGHPDPPRSAKTTDDSGMSHPVRLRIDDFYAGLETRNAFELLEIGRDADDRAVKRAYFKLSKEFHPDRYFGKDIGDYKDRLSKIFQAVKASFELLSDKRRRQAYEESLG
jgi:hypothetical protein